MTNHSHTYIYLCYSIFNYKSSYQDFLDRGLLLTRKLLNQGFLLVKLKSSLRKFCGRHHYYVDRYGIAVSQMTTNMFRSHLYISKIKPERSLKCKYNLSMLSLIMQILLQIFTIIHPPIMVIYHYQVTLKIAQMKYLFFRANEKKIWKIRANAIPCHLPSTRFTVCKFVLVTNTADLVLNNNQLIWSDSFTFLFYRALFLHSKGNKSVIRFRSIVLVSNIVRNGRLWSVVRQTYPHTCRSQRYLLHTRCNMCNHKYS